jgi:hypothetical protein
MYSLCNRQVNDENVEKANIFMQEAARALAAAEARALARMKVVGNVNAKLAAERTLRNEAEVRAVAAVAAEVGVIMKRAERDEAAAADAKKVLMRVY